ncbi:MAG: adenylosuccinate lyase [Planctomycetota bacterium]|nr:MAG: adenylosuccinate lyase [Planctomycetota bacterium]REJ93165.1 MAG: adenylosuccinate lyase [Planctomycetota bacterium]REK23350.1 MAG: adenylosuccinate lyase [Planctomycetota bacterium]REK47153.1 MAG: adenylosuccinate lyase [Planctomycetota bacterium]
MSHELYENPLIARYASAEMGRLWGPERKFRTWRKLWIWLAEAEQELGLPISDEQIAELKAHADTIDFAQAAEYEGRLRHDVMAHVHTYGDACPTARPIIHLGATSCFVTDNTDLLLLREALTLVRDRLVAVIDRLARFAAAHRELACLGYTHLQPAQPTTVGKRATLWAYDLVMDLEEIERRLAALRARSTKGTTGTQASFLNLFDGDAAKVVRLEQLVAAKMGFDGSYAVTGQTYSRKVDAQVVDALAGIAASAHKAGSDLRLLQSRRELAEPQGSSQIGSSAMAYKRNPMRSERICGLARFVMSLQTNTSATLATQWMERTLDDSANRRIVLPQAFLAIDAILSLYQNVAEGLVAFPRVIERNLAAELPQMATENILMAAVRAGGDRQELHEKIRAHSVEAARVVNEEGGENDLVARLAADPAFAAVDFSEVLDVRQFVGRAPEQVDEFLRDVIEPIRGRYPAALAGAADVRV